MQQIPLEKTLDVNAVEHQFVELWKQTAGGTDSSADDAVLRARVANLLVFLSNKSMLDEVVALMPELTEVHPSRALVMLGEREAGDRDIEMFVSSYCTGDDRTEAKRLCCEEVLLKARGYFVDELPSAALPLMVSDLSTFLWWRARLQSNDSVLRSLLTPTDRLIIDSAEFEDPQGELLQVHELYQSEHAEVGVSDINWARLTFWRGLLADFYDVHAYKTPLDLIEQVHIDYVSPARNPNAVAPQALLYTGWLASRLGWNIVRAVEQTDDLLAMDFSIGEPTAARLIKVQLSRVDSSLGKPGRLTRVELHTDSNGGALFKVMRSADNLHLFTEAQVGSATERGRVLPVRNRSNAQLISREMEILCNDQIYEDAVAEAMKIHMAMSTR
jgi:glucose-6-phosphate dehydrogenase assembly protein OpcA